jgi:HrpA-like RNA helicase
VTIDDIEFVIDTGRVKEMKLINNVLSLCETWVSLSSAKQRRGRAGRVKPGHCFKLFSSFFSKKHMAKFTEPEILRLPLEQLCLQIKAMKMNDVVTFLGKALSPPPLENVRNALELLENVNALDEDQNLTPLGHHIATIPTDIRIAKMLVFGAVFHCIEPILTIATSLSGKSPFVSPADRRDEAQQAHAQFYIQKSDHLMLCKSYDDWVSVGKQGKSAQWSFCEKNFLSMTTLMTMSDLRKQFCDTLIELGYVSKERWVLLNTNSKNYNVIKAVILAGLYPNIASIQMPKQLYDQTAEGAVAIAAKSNEIHFYTSTDSTLYLIIERVFIHPSSSIFSEQSYQNPILTYGAKVSTSKIFLRECTEIPAVALCLLGGKIRMLHGGKALEINGIRFRAFSRILALITGMRRLLDITLDEKIDKPAIDVTNSAAGKICLQLLNGI